MKRSLFLVGAALGFVCSIAAAQPKAVIQNVQKQLWGMTSIGGSGQDGIIFKIDRQGSKFKVKHDFVQQGPNNTHPNASLIQARDGKLYGLSHYGGQNDQGLLYQIDAPTSTYAVKIEFDRNTLGSYPDGTLLEASDGMLYGMTSQGGSADAGVIFQYNPTSGVLHLKYSFDGAAHGGTPFGALIQASDGKIYGMTSEGGKNDQGVVFSYDISSGTCTTLASFDASTVGRNPHGALVQTADGKMYGLCYKGGTNESGTLFQFDPKTSSLTLKYQFDGADNGGEPMGSLCLANDAKLYGVTFSGGTNSVGILFRFDPASGTLTKRLDFDELISGASPLCTLVQNIDGLLFGMCSLGGASAGPTSKGCVFTYDIAANTLTKKLDFDGSNGANPLYTSFVEIPVTISTQAELQSYCAGNKMHVTYRIAGAYDDDNVFSVQLSDSLGSFTNAIVIGSANTTQAGSIDCWLPVGVPEGSKYRVRVIASGPIVTGSDNGSDIVIHALPSARISIKDSLLVAAQTGAHYQWFNCAAASTPLPGATNQSYRPIVSGNYAVEVTNPTTACMARSECISMTVSDVPPEYTEEWSLQPNPASEYARLLNPLPTQQVHATLVDVRGEVLQSLDVHSSGDSIDLHAYASGQYFVIIQLPYSRIVLPCRIIK